VLGALYLSTHTLELVRPWLNSSFQRLAAEIRSDQDLATKAALRMDSKGHFKVARYRVQETPQPPGNPELVS